jgi:heme/copper-type cytochrome/quinol oxidase subunit 1
MTLTETRPETAAEIQLVPPPRPEPGGLAAYLGTGDHKRLGRMFIGVALLWLLVGVVGGAVVGFEQVDQGGLDVFEADTYFQASTLVAQVLVFLGVLPLLLGLAVYVTPLQVGSRTIAFPRATSAAFYGYLVGGVMLVGSYAANGGPGGGEEQAVDLWILSFGMVLLALLVGGLAVATTVITLRTPGMYLDRVPLFAWSMLVSASLWLVTLPVMLAALVLGYVDHRYGRLGLGGNYDLYPWYHWMIRQPQVFLYAIPALGIVAEVVAVLGGARQRLYRTVMVLIAAAGVLAFGAYSLGLWAGLVRAVPLLDVSTSDWPIYSNWVFVGAALLLPLPILLLLGGLTDTLVRGRDRQLGAPLLLALLSGLMLLTGASAAALAVIEPLDLLPTSWSAGVAMLAIGGAITGALAGVQYWAVKIWGRAIPNGAGLLVALLLAVGVFAIAGGQMLAGVYDQPDIVTVAANGAEGEFEGELEVRDAVDTGNVISLLGWASLAGGVVVFGLGLLGGLLRPTGDEGAADDPWNGHTLEWATTSPPPTGNFAEVALVTSEAPLLDARSGSEDA